MVLQGGLVKQIILHSKEMVKMPVFGDDQMEEIS